MPNPQLSDDEIEKTDDWLDDHGQPDFEYLHSLATDAGPRAMEKLRFIAEDLDAEYDSNASAEDLIERIRSAAEKNAGGGGGITA